jgi:hypothetical protein
LGEVTGVGVGDDPLSLLAECELGVAEEGVVGSRDEATRHLHNGVRGSGLDPGSEFLGLGFQFGAERLGHGDLLPG